VSSRVVEDFASPRFVANADCFSTAVASRSIGRLAMPTSLSRALARSDARGRVDDLCRVENGVGQRRFKGRIEPRVDVKKKIGSAVLAG
jgi:hypothetical protein